MRKKIPTNQLVLKASSGHLPEIGEKGGFRFTNNPNLLFLAFLVFLAFFLFKEFLTILSVFPFFPKDFRGSAGRKKPCLFGVFFLAVFHNCKEKKIREGMGNLHKSLVRQPLGFFEPNIGKRRQADAKPTLNGR